MTGKLLLALVFTFTAGICVGYWLPHNENEPPIQPEFELGGVEEDDEPSRESSPTTEEFDQNVARDAENRGHEGSTKRRQQKAPTDEIKGRVYAFIGFDAQGAESGHWPAAPLSSGEFLIPAMALRAVVTGQVVSVDGSRNRVLKVKGLGDRGVFAVVTSRDQTKSWQIRKEPIRIDESLWVLNSSKSSLIPQPAKSGRRRFDQELRMELIRLEGQFDLPHGGFVLDQKNQLLALALPSDQDGNLRALEVVDFHRDRLRLLDLKLADYYKVYFEGSLEALLKEARHHLENRRFLRAIETYRILVDRSNEMRETVHAEFLEAVHGRLDELPLATNPQGRIRFLRQAIRDFPAVGGLWFELAQVARKLRLYEESIQAWEGAWKANSDLVVDLVGSKNAIYFEWIRSHVDRDRVEDALQVILIALADTGGSSEILLLQGKLLIRRREYLAAADAMRDAVQMDPSLGSSLDEAIARAERLAEGPGKVVIDYPPGSRAIIASVRLNGKASGDFIVDTGATTSMVPTALAQRAGLDTSDRVPKVRLQTAGNERIVPFSPVDSISLGILSVSGVSVVVGDISGKSGYGLLGMDFLGEFHIENDSQNGRLVISTRQ